MVAFTIISLLLALSAAPVLAAPVPTRGLVTKMHSATEIDVRIATTVVTAHVLNPNSTDAQLLLWDALLPRGAFVTGLTVRIGGTVYVGDVREADEAQQAFDDAVDAGQAAGLVTASEERLDTYGLAINVPPLTRAEFELHWVAVVERAGGLVGLTLGLAQGGTQPAVDDMLVTVGGVVPGGVSSVEAPLWPNATDISTSLGGTRFDVVFRPTVEEQLALGAPVGIINGPVAASSTTGGGGGGGDGEVGAIYNLVVRFEPAEQLSSVGTLYATEEPEDPQFFAHVFAPTGLQQLPLCVSLVLDVSGSMSGQKIVQAREALIDMLQSLQSTDFFSVVTFAGDVASFRPSVVQATPTNVGAAVTWVAQRQASGGTNLHGGLMLGLGHIADFINNVATQPFSPTVVCLSDGEPTSGVTADADIISSVQVANQEIGAGLWQLGFGAYADMELLQGISDTSGAEARRIDVNADAVAQMTGFFAEISAPQVRNVDIAYGGETGEHTQNVTETKFAQLYDGKEVLVAGQVSGATSMDNMTLTASALTGEGTVRFDGPLLPTTAASGGSELDAAALRQLWAVLTVQELRAELERGADTMSNATLTAERRRLIDLCLEFQLVVPSFTSLVVVVPNSTETIPTGETSPELGFGQSSTASGGIGGSSGNFGGQGGPANPSYGASASVTRVGTIPMLFCGLAVAVTVALGA